MPRFNTDLTVTQSLLDRLVDNEPGLAADPPMTRAQSVRLLKASVRRDLEWLLNTRRTPLAVDEEYPELHQSLYNYGLPDFSTLNMGSYRDRDRLLLSLEATVGHFEPRLKDINVSLVETPSATDRSIRFQIDGVLDMDPAPEHVSFDTVLQLTSGEYQIRG